MVKRKLLTALCLSLSFSTLGLSGCSSIKLPGYEIEIKKSNEEDKEEKEDNKDVEEKDDNKELEEKDDNKELEEKDDVKVKEDEEEEVESNLFGSDDELGSEDYKSDVSKEEDSIKDTEEYGVYLTGVRQYNGFKAEMPSKYKYYGTKSQDNVTLSLFIENSKNKNNVNAMIITIVDYADFGVNFNDMDEEDLTEIANSQISSKGKNYDVQVRKVGGDNIIFYSAEQSTGINTNAFYFKDDMLCMIMNVTKKTKDESIKDIEELLSIIEFNGEKCEEELDKIYDIDTDIKNNLQGLFNSFNSLNSNGTGTIDKESKDSDNIGKKQDIERNSSVETFSLNGEQIVLNQTTFEDMIKIGKVTPEVKDYSTLVFIDFKEDNTNRLEIITRSTDKSAKIESLSVDYSNYYDNKYQIDEIPWGSSLDDVIEKYGSYTDSDDGIYSWNLSETIELVVYASYEDNKTITHVEFEYTEPY